MKNVKIWKKIVITALSVFMLTEPALKNHNTLEHAPRNAVDTIRIIDRNL